MESLCPPELMEVHHQLTELISLQQKLVSYKQHYFLIPELTLNNSKIRFLLLKFYDLF